MNMQAFKVRAIKGVRLFLSDWCGWYFLVWFHRFNVEQLTEHLSWEILESKHMQCSTKEILWMCYESDGSVTWQCWFCNTIWYNKISSDTIHYVWLFLSILFTCVSKLLQDEVYIICGINRLRNTTPLSFLWRHSMAYSHSPLLF